MRAAALFDAGAWGRLMGLEVESDPFTGLLIRIRPSPGYSEPWEAAPTNSNSNPNPALARMNAYIREALECIWPIGRMRAVTCMLDYLAREPEAMDFLLSERRSNVRLRAMVFDRSLVGWWADADGASKPNLKGAARLLLHRATAAQLVRSGCGVWAATMDAVRGLVRAADSRLARLPDDVVEAHLLPLLGDMGIERVLRGFGESVRRHWRTQPSIDLF